MTTMSHDLLCFSLSALLCTKLAQLGPYGFVIYMFVDGYSRCVLSVRVTEYDGSR